MGYWCVVNYREAYNMFAVNGILFNHESPRRGETFVTRKITRAVAAIKAGMQESVSLGNLNSTRDWGHARDYVECMWLMLQQDAPEDFVVATGETHSVKEFCELAFGHAGMPLTWKGEGINEVTLGVPPPRAHGCRFSRADFLVPAARRLRRRLCGLGRRLAACWRRDCSRLAAVSGVLIAAVRVHRAGPGGASGSSPLWLLTFAFAAAGRGGRQRRGAGQGQPGVLSAHGGAISCVANQEPKDPVFLF